ncbi:MAG TPA: response regulator [Kofleriaceae bacterium]|nr:response regulator [Kofleriaceae bacterium]
MNTAGRILIVDDDPDFVASYKEFLTAEGYAVEVASNGQEARTRFEEPGWGLIVIDQKLRGPGGPDEGLDLAVVAMRKAPEAKVIIATAYAEPASIARAFDLGVYDYLQKDQFFEALLRAKVRNAMEVWRERALAALSTERREQELASAWEDAQTVRDPQLKGDLLEFIMFLLFRTIPGFEHAQVNRQNHLEEIDVLVQNSSTDPFWQREGSYLLIECKNWSSPVGVPELKLFRQKIGDRFGRSTLGFMIAMNGYTETTKIEEWTRRGEQSLVVLLTREDLDALVATRDRSAKLKEFHARAVVARRD